MSFNPRLTSRLSRLQTVYAATAYPDLVETRNIAYLFLSNDGKNFYNVGPKEGLFTRDFDLGGWGDSDILYWKNVYYLVNADSTNGIFQNPYIETNPPCLRIWKSLDLLSWEQIVAIPVDPTPNLGGINVPSWVVDNTGPAIICVPELFPNHRITVVRPNSSDPITWGNINNWSSPVNMTDTSNTELIQGNTYVAFRDGIYYMVFNDVSWGGYKKRTSSSLTSGWSAWSSLDIDSTADSGDSANIVVTPEGKWRFYVSNGNQHTYQLWYYESDDFVNWSSATELDFFGLGSGKDINWAAFAIIKAPINTLGKAINSSTPEPPILFLDSSSNNLTVNGYGSIATSSEQSKFSGGKSLKLDITPGTINSIKIIDPLMLDIGINEAFTIEMWIYQEVLSDSSYVLFSVHGGSGSSWSTDNGLQMTCYLDADNNLIFYGRTPSGSDGVITDPIPFGEWIHLAISYDGTIAKIFINGQAPTSGADIEIEFTTAPSVSTFQIGAQANNYQSKLFIDDFRVVKGTGLYSSAFSVPNSSLTAVSGTALLLHFDD